MLTFNIFLTGLEDQGLYRLVGVSSKVSKLLAMGLDRRKGDKMSLEDRLEWENKTITSALKTYLRSLPEPLMSFRYHTAFIAAASTNYFLLQGCVNWFFDLMLSAHFS